MAPPDPNLPHLRSIAEALGDLCADVVFVGGSTAGLLLTDPMAAGVRPTFDIDAIVQADNLVQFYRIESRLEQRGFIRDAASAVICRWQHRPTGILFDLMPVDAAILGFANRWYPEAIRTAHVVQLEQDREIRVVSPPAFAATKLEAFLDRGRGDFMSSHDVEDVLAVVDGRPELVEELLNSGSDLRHFVAKTFANLLNNPDFVNCLPGLIADADRAGIVAGRMRRMAACE